MADDKKPESVVETAKKRYQRALDANSTLRQQAIADTRFALGDSDNNWQWPEEIYATRATVQKKPCLTVNITAQHCNQIINAIRQNRPSGKVLPVDGKADPDTAEKLGGLIRSIQNYSRADTAHDIAAEHAIYGGEGYWRVITEYESDDSFNLALRIKAITNPNNVLVDPDAQEPDRSDAKWGFVFEDIPTEDAQREYPNLSPESWVEDGDRGWVKKDTVRIGDYYYCRDVQDELWLMLDGSTILKSQVPEGVKIVPTKKRKVTRKQWYSCKLVGGASEPVNEQLWPGNYLPIISVLGKEINVNGELVRKGLVRDLKDPARMANYSFSAAVETLALQTRTPWVASAEAVEGYEDQWGAANIENLAYLPFNAYDDQGRELPVPSRTPPTQMATAQVQMLELSVEQMRAASGQQNANFGIKSEAQSGIGIQRLKAQGEIATFHFPDNLSRALTYELKVLIDLIPKIYDTQRIVRILGLDGSESMAMVDNEHPEAHTKVSDRSGVEAIFNPLMGRYDVAIDTGPSYQTQRQEAADALTQIASKYPPLMQVAGDIVMRSYDFPMAQELADRLKKTIPPNLLEQEDGQQEIPPQVQAQLQQMQQQIEHMQQSGAEIQAENEQLKSEREVELKRLLIDAYGKETDRIKALGGALTPEAVQSLVIQTLQQALSTPSPAEVIEPGPPDLDPMQGEQPQEQAPQGAFSMGQQSPAAMPAPGANPGLA